VRDIVDNRALDPVDAVLRITVGEERCEQQNSRQERQAVVTRSIDGFTRAGIDWEASTSKRKRLSSDSNGRPSKKENTRVSG
jgi:hypothetical protein